MDRLNELSLPDQCLVHRILYYCFGDPVLDDHIYDKLEREADKVAPPDHLLNQPGSDMLSTYPQWAIDLAIEITHPLL